MGVPLMAISREEACFYVTLLDATEWITAADLAAKAGVSGRSARLYCERYVGLGIAEVVKLHPAHRYAFCGGRNTADKKYMQALQQAASIFYLDRV